MLFATVLMDVVLLIFISGFLIKYIIIKDKESKGLKWIISGGIVGLLSSVIPFNDWSSVFGISVPQNLIGMIMTTVTFILVLIGSIN